MPAAKVAAVEITSEVEEARLDLEAAADRHLSTLKLAGSNCSWQVGLSANSWVNAISRGALLSLPHDMEQHGRQSAMNIGDSRDPFVVRLGALGIESVHCWKAKPGRESVVRVGAGFYSGREWDQAAIDRWLDGLLTSARGQNKL